MIRPLKGGLISFDSPKGVEGKGRGRGGGGEEGLGEEVREKKTEEVLFSLSPAFSLSLSPCSLLFFCRRQCPHFRPGPPPSSK